MKKLFLSFFVFVLSSSCATTKQTENCLCEEGAKKTATVDENRIQNQEPVYSDDDFFSPLEEIKELLSTVVEDKFVNGGRIKAQENKELQEEYPPNKYDPHPM